MIFFRRLRLSEFFNTDTTTDVISSDIPFRKRFTWTPNINRDKFLKSYIPVVEDEILNDDRKFFHKNLTVSDLVDLRELKSYDDIVIKEADKGSAVLVMDKSLYIKEGHRLLDDTNVYQLLHSDCTQDIIHEIQSTLIRLEAQGVLSKDMVSFANPVNTKPSRSYLLPKVHKCGVPGRPVISSCSSPTEKISELVHQTT